MATDLPSNGDKPDSVETLAAVSGAAPNHSGRQPDDPSSPKCKLSHYVELFGP